MKWVIIIPILYCLFGAIASVVFAEDSFVWFDSTGMVVELKEKYGGTTMDTCTVLTIKNETYFTTHRNGPGNTYPLANWSVTNIKKGEVK